MPDLLRPGPIATLTLEEWNRLLSVNLTGYFLCAKAFGRQMLERHRGSDRACRLHRWTSSAALERIIFGQQGRGGDAVPAAGRGVGTVGYPQQCGQPGLVRTPMSEPFYRIPEVPERRAGIVPLRRVAAPHDIADVVVFLASDRAGYVNGEDVCTDGGFGRVLMGLVPRPGFEAHGPAES